jgi:hypothetical protein
MDQLRFGASAWPIHFPFPVEWKGEDVTAVTLAIEDRDGNELMAADAITLYTATTLKVAVERFASSINLADAAGNLSEGDTVKLVGIEGSEAFRIKGWDSTNNVGELEGFTENEYAIGDDVYGLFGDYELDISDTDTFTAGIVLRFIWTPTGSGLPVTWLAQVAASALDISGLRQDFADLYPRAYDAFLVPHDRLDRMQAIAERQLASEAMGDTPPWDIQRVVDQQEVLDTVMVKMAYLWTLNGDKQLEDERKALGEEYAIRKGVLKALALWVDDDQDGIEDDGEKASHGDVQFNRTW